MNRSPFLRSIPVVGDRDGWRARGLCHDDPDLFFPSSRKDEASLAAKNVCRRCPVITECLEWALTHEEHGVWGGLSAKERRALGRTASTSHRGRPLSIVG